jgi:RNA polymerase sigma-70 factor (ECF subfamily)
MRAADLRAIDDVAGTADLRALVEQAKRGDVDAWETLYRRAYPALMAYASRRLEIEQAKDAVSETMTRAVTRIEKFEWRAAGFHGWLFGILRHVVIDTYRAQARSARVDGFATIAHDESIDRVLRDEETVAVRRAFAMLDPADREILELRVVARLSCDEVGVALSMRPGAVRMAQSRALARLRLRLGELT